MNLQTLNYVINDIITIGLLIVSLLLFDDADYKWNMNRLARKILRSRAPLPWFLARISLQENNNRVIIIN